MNQSIINHLFLPHHLPSSADDDFLLQSNHEKEHVLLERMKEYLNSIESTDTTKLLSVFPILNHCIQRWLVLQNPQTISVNLETTIQQLPSGHFLPLYFHAQNAAVLIEIDEKNSEQALISAWQVLLPSAVITSCVAPHLSCFPVTTYKLNDRSQLMSKTNCEILMDFMSNTIEYSKSAKSGRAVDEIRDIPISNYVCQWWIQQFQGVTINTDSVPLIHFKKKHRDHIRWKDALSPFRRSGLWMTIKVIFHTILTKRLGNIGTIVYKVLITHFLTYIICTWTPSIDVLIHCIRKIVRRLNKIDCLSLPGDSNDLNQWIRHMKQEIEVKINKITPKPNWERSIQTAEEKINIIFDQSEFYQHSFMKFKDYLNEENSGGTNEYFSGNNSDDDSNQMNQDDYIPSIQLLTTKYNHSISIALIRIEIWIESRLEQWINRVSTSRHKQNRFETLWRFFEEYQNAALSQYYSDKGPTDPLGYSRFILASLTVICSMHKNLCLDPRFIRLKEHSIHIPNLINLFEYLILPNQKDMIRSRNLYNYFCQFIDKLNPDLLKNIEHSNAFGVHFANQTQSMYENIPLIRAQAKRDKQQKISEVNAAKQKYQQLMDRVSRLSCEYDKYGHSSYCSPCAIHREARNIQVQIFECPLPVNYESALAVIFELQMPIEIRCYRDILWQFINRPNPNPNPKIDTYEWLKVPPHNDKLGPYYTDPGNSKVKFVSHTKSVTQSHYSYPPSIVSTPVEGFLFENSLTVGLSPTSSIQIEDECCILTPQLDHSDYKQLQFTIDTTTPVQNNVIAQLSNCPSRMKHIQFVEYGSFRSGHCLQWWNLLAILETDRLSLAEESVAILVIHSILQYGPITETLLSSWCPESHDVLFEDYFTDELVLILHRHLDDCELNWQNELVLIVITMITMRILTICNSTKENQVFDLALKCRRTGEKWIELIGKSIQTVTPAAFSEVEKLRSKMVNVSISCLLTFSTHSDRFHCVLSSNEHVVSLLKATSTIHDNIILNKNQTSMSTFMKNMMRFGEYTSVMIQPIVAKVLEQTSYQSLNEFAAIYWAVIRSKGTMNGQWKKRRVDMHDGWYDCQYESRYISLNCITGTFLVDNMTIGFLPETITLNELFVRVFDSYVFEVQAAESPNTYITKHDYHGVGKVQYEFRFDEQIKHLIIMERHIQTNEIFQLIPHSCFVDELPDAFTSNHSHWWNRQNQTIDFRPIRFVEPDFLDNKSYQLSLTAGRVTTTKKENTQVLVNQSSTFFQTLFNRYFVRLDDKPYVYMLHDSTIHIYLSRLGIAFQCNHGSNIIVSREYSDMCIEEKQWLDTLTGLKSGLVLSPLPVNKQKLEHYPYRKLIVPFGHILSERKYTNHQTVRIQRPASMPFLQQYFVFIMNDQLQILQSTDSPTGWLYLALLHAMTSHPLPDKYTGMTGIERAFQLLNSAGCWSYQPFDELSLNILEQIASITPRVNYYPEHLTCMETVDWSSNGLPYSMQHFGYYLITKQLVTVSQQLNFMHSSIPDKIPAIFRRKNYNEVLLKKLYWDYRDSYNPTARLPLDMEANISFKRSSAPYQLASEDCTHGISYRVIRPTNDIYKSGRVHLKDLLKQHWLPLSQWLSQETSMKTIWIGLLQMADSAMRSSTETNRDAIERCEKLFDFLYHISNKLNINRYYLEMLKTTLKMPYTLLTFPPFIRYKNIEDTTVVEDRIQCIEYYSECKRNRIIRDVQDCFRRNCRYENYGKRTTDSETIAIDKLLDSWQNNRKLRSFLEDVENRIYSIPIEQFHIRVSYIPQEYAVESIDDHHQIQLRPAKKCINQRELRPAKKCVNQRLLSIAKQRFHHPYSGHFIKSAITPVNTNRQNKFPKHIFSSTNNQKTSLKEINNYFENQLDKSWQELLSEEPILKENPTFEEINEWLNCLQEESRQAWDHLVTSLRKSNEQLFDVGLISRITRTNVISLLQRKLTIPHLSTDQRTLLGGIIVNWTLQQQLERARYFLIHEKLEDFNREISNIPHSNWTPSNHISWLLLELEMNITIRETQIRVAHHMMQPNQTENNSTIKNIVMQMNMGEGKTSVILPMLAVGLCSSGSSLVRIIVLKSLFPVNYQSLRYKLGGLLNQRIFPFSCRRDMNFSFEQVNQIYKCLKQGLRSCEVILTSPEDILSFDLLTIDKCRRNEFDTGRSMLNVQRWLKTYARDVLDESDEILHVKYQLVYTVGGQQQVDAGGERWKTIQSILDLVKKHAESIANQFSKEVCYKPSERKSAFPQFRLQSQQPFPELCKQIADDWFNASKYRSTDRPLILSFILDTNRTVNDLEYKFPRNDINLMLIIRGLLSSEVLLVAFKKRYRVNYGVNTNLTFNRLMAVPFRAKDVVSDRTEFGHPDVALVLTQLSYFYSGLNEEQLTRCFDRLSEEETDPAAIYDEWISYEDENDIPTNIRQWKGVNLKDYQQRTQYLFPTFQKNMRVINYFLNQFVYPREAKQFPHKLVSSAWDLSSSIRLKIITGFSGTNDTQLLLPIHIRQYDLPELQKTDAIVVNNLIQSENEHYQSLPINATSNEILKQIINYQEKINVILDVGALFIDGSNQDIAQEWLKLSDKNQIDYAVYFQSNDSIVVCDRHSIDSRPFATSPASERLDYCVFYLDEIHTRGTDFKFPKGFRAAVTLGNGLTKDRFVQAAMRMRKLGHGHSLTFWSSHEVHQQIIGLEGEELSGENQDRISVIDILRWVYGNTVQSIWEGLHHWASQSSSFQRKVAAFRNVQWKNDQQLFTDAMMTEIATECLEPEIIELKHMYGASKDLKTLIEIHTARYQQINYQFSTEIRDAVLQRLQDYGGLKERLSQLLDEEQQRELEQELEEERQTAPPPPVIPCEIILHKEIDRLCDIGAGTLNLSQLSNVFRLLPYAFTDTTFANECQPNSWQSNLWISTEFQRVIATKGESLNSFMRPPRWIIVYRNRDIIFLSTHEANRLIRRLQSNRSSITTLRLLLSRIKRSQSIFINTHTLTVPPTIELTGRYDIPLAQLVQLFIFNGTIYFETKDEQTAYCQCLSLCPKPRTNVEEQGFQENWIAVDGFVKSSTNRHHLQLQQARFIKNPLLFVKQLIENRNNSHASITSHVGSIIFNSAKLL